MSTRTQSANARPRSSASSSQEKEEDKEPRQDPTGVSAVGASESGAEDGANSKGSGGVSSPAKDSGSPSSPSAEANENGKNRANAAPASPAGSASNGAAAEENGDMALLKGKKVLKTVGQNKVMEGYVESYVPAKDGQEEKWLLKWDDDVDEEVTKAELDKWINLHNVRKWSKGGKKRDRVPRTPSSPGKRATKRRQKENSPSPSTGKKTRSRSSEDNGAASPTATPKTRSSTSSSSSRSSNKKAKVSSHRGRGRKSGRLRGNASDVGTLVAKEFTEGVFTGVVTKVKQGSPTLWSVRYEDEDAEDLEESEMATPMQLYETLLAKFEEASGHAVTPEEEEAEKGDDDVSGSQKTPKKGKGKAKKGSKGEPAVEEKSSHVGARVRKFFQKYGEFDGKVTKHSSANDKDDLGDLWLVKYDDGDSEHMSEAELLEARALYDKHYVLERKEIDLESKETSSGKKATNIPKVTSCVMYAEKPKGSRLFAKIKNYRRWKETS